MIELLPCPFCGDKAKVSNGKKVYIHCTNCYSQTPSININKYTSASREDLAQKVTIRWNRRCKMVDTDTSSNMNDIYTK